MTDRQGQAVRSSTATEFGDAAAHAGLDARLLAQDFPSLMSIPVNPEIVGGPQLALAPTGAGAATSLVDPKLLIAMLNALSLEDLMRLAVESGLDLKQDIGHLNDKASPSSDASIAAYLHGLLSMSLSDLMAVDALDDLVITKLADGLGPDAPPLNPAPQDRAGAVPTGSPPPSDHLPPAPQPPAETAPTPVRGLFTAGNDTVLFDSISAGAYQGAALQNALGGNDHVTLPSDLTQAQQAGYNPLLAFSGGSGNDTLVPGGLADIIDGGAGLDTVSYQGSSGVVVLLQDSDIHGPHAGEPAGGTGGLAEGDSYAGVENVIASDFDDYVFGGADGGIVLLLGGNDEYDNPAVQDVPDQVDGGAGNDAIWAGGGGDTLLGGADADRLNGESGTDSLDGGLGADTLAGGEDNDILDGGAGIDRLSGNEGDDILVWRNSESLLAGGTGTDTLRNLGGDLALGGLAGIASGIERIDLAFDTGANLLTLAAADIIGISDTDGLTVTGTAADSLNAGAGWTDSGSDGAGNHIYTKLVGAALATLVVSDAITVNPDITS